MSRHTSLNKSVSLIFPHQLIKENPCLAKQRTIVLVEEYLFFRQYSFHKQKIAFHRASMRFYENYLKGEGYDVIYIESKSEVSDVRNLLPFLSEQGVKEIYFCDVCDDWLNRRILRGCENTGLIYYEYDSPLFINTKKDINKYFDKKKRFFQTDFYINQRKTRSILLESDESPVGGKWSFDTENRLKYPAKKSPPKILSLPENTYDLEAKKYTEKYFSSNYGEITFKYPTTFSEALAWFNDFLENRFNEFGKYEDAIVAEELILHHSVLSPLINTGLLVPEQIIDKTISIAKKKNIPLGSLEGFIRQIIGWREFIRGVYTVKGREERTRNFWNFNRKIPISFWNGTTGIEPVDITIKKILRTGYCHHIERLMVLGNFMLLCEFDPDEVYRWFMEMFIDSYDWVMVPNVYGMSQFADGGLMATKPYISGSNYLIKMGNYKKGPWQNVWDGLFWNFMNNHRNFLMKNPRLGMLIKNFDTMDESRKQNHLHIAGEFLQAL